MVVFGRLFEEKPPFDRRSPVIKMIWRFSLLVHHIEGYEITPPTARYAMATEQRACRVAPMTCVWRAARFCLVALADELSALQRGQRVLTTSTGCPTIAKR